jgi:putative PIN family toxin of toxin-antitoxin system
VRVVIDTNVWVSGLLWGGLPGAVIKLAERAAITVYATGAMLAELQEVLERPQLEPRRRELGLEVADLVAYAAGLLTVIDLTNVPALVPDDPDDDVIVACAIAVGANFIISGDRHLQVLQQVGGIPVVTPQGFLAHIQSSSTS